MVLSSLPPSTSTSSSCARQRCEADGGMAGLRSASKHQGKCWGTLHGSFAFYHPIVKMWCEFLPSTSYHHQVFSYFCTFHFGIFSALIGWRSLSISSTFWKKTKATYIASSPLNILNGKRQVLSLCQTCIPWTNKILPMLINICSSVWTGGNYVMALASPFIQDWVGKQWQLISPNILQRFERVLYKVAIPDNFIYTLIHFCSFM